MMSASATPRRSSTTAARSPVRSLPAAQWNTTGCPCPAASTSTARAVGPAPPPRHPPRGRGVGGGVVGQAAPGLVQLLDGAQVDDRRQPEPLDDLLGVGLADPVERIAA